VQRLLKKPLARALLAAVSLAASVPASLVATFLLTPLWRVVDQRLGVEAIGHSAPARWCFLVVYAATALAAVAASSRLVRDG
jgi:hypothetical protein